MTETTKQIIKEIKALKFELKNIKKRMVDIDVVLTDDDTESIKEAERDLKEGKTKRLI